jgi:hypothetical protein
LLLLADISAQSKSVRRACLGGSLSIEFEPNASRVNGGVRLDQKANTIEIGEPTSSRTTANAIGGL